MDYKDKHWVRVDKENEIKFRTQMSEEEYKEFREFKNESIRELMFKLHEDRASLRDFGFFQQGFAVAKKQIIKFLINKQMGYGDAYFFKISEIEEIGESK